MTNRPFTAQQPGALLLILLAAFLLQEGCTRRPPPPAPLPRPAPTEPTTGPSGPADPSDVTAPELDVRVEPTTIARGESALLTWNSRNASRIYIDPNIGFVDPAGRIKFFPDETTTYTVTAEGPGGRVSESVTVEVKGPGGAIDQSDLPPEAPPGTFEEAVRPVFFAFDSSELTEKARDTLDANIAWLMQPDHRDIQFVIEGHADERGSEEYNFALGDKRAETVRLYLTDRGIDPTRMITVSMGEEQPFSGGTTERDHALNRRAHFVILHQSP